MKQNNIWEFLNQREEILKFLRIYKVKNIPNEKILLWFMIMVGKLSASS